MRHLALLAVLMPSVAVADDKPEVETPKKADKPKGRLANPWPQMPHPRDGMKLPDPRKAAEKAAADGVVAPVTPEDTAPPKSQEPQIATEPVGPPFVPAAATLPALPPPSTPLGVTTLSLKPPPPVAPHEGFTFEAGTGVGWIQLADRSSAVRSLGVSRA